MDFPRWAENEAPPGDECNRLPMRHIWRSMFVPEWSNHEARLAGMEEVISRRALAMAALGNHEPWPLECMGEVKPLGDWAYLVGMTPRQMLMITRHGGRSEISRLISNLIQAEADNEPM